MTDKSKNIIIEVQIICISTAIFLYEVYKLLSIKLAEEIVQQTMKRLHHNINVISTEGVILASGDKERIDSIHSGAKHVAATGQTLFIDHDNAKDFENCKPGINMPIKYRDEIIGVIGITGNPLNLGEIANLVQLTTEMLVHQVLTENESEWQRKNGDFIFKALIEDMPIDRDLQIRIQKLPFLFKGPFQVILLEVDEMDSSNRLALYLENILYKRPALFGQISLSKSYILLCGCNENDTEMIIKQIAKHRNKIKLSVGVGPTVSAIEQLSLAYLGAKTALRFSAINKNITFFEEVELYTVFKDYKCPEVDAFLSRVLKGIGEKLIHTLQVLFESNLQLNLCAEKLGIHRHTLTYRLNQIHEHTGYNPQNFQDAYLLKTAMLLKNQI